MTDIWTIGHSTRILEAFVESLRSFRIEVLADVRRFPHSRRHPQFNTDELKKALFLAKIRYEYFGDALGGFRKPSPKSRHLGLENSSFQGYADHMETATFRQGLAKLIGLARAHRVAYMCSESNYKSCHRRLISDALELLHGFTVHHISDPGKAFRHAPVHEARAEGGSILYAPRPLEEFPAAPENTARKETRG